MPTSETSAAGPGVSRNWPPIVLLIASGLVALVFQVLWVRQLSVAVGVEVHAVTIGISAFFLGLAAGGLLLGRLADRIRRPLRWYAWLELGVAGLGLAATYVLHGAADWFGLVRVSHPLLAWSALYASIAVPATLMGGTLPALLRSLVPHTEGISRQGGRCYAANTLGAILGALLAPFVLLGAFGLRGTAVVVAGLGLVTAGMAFLLDRRLVALAPVMPAPAPPEAHRHSAPTTALLVYAVAGGLALGYEVVWSQALVQFLSTRSYAFAVMLATYLGGLTLGAGVYARFSSRIRNSWGTFGLLIAAAGLTALLPIACAGEWLLAAQSSLEAAVQALTGSRTLAMCARFALAAVYMALVPTILLGAAFPAALRLVVDAGHVGRDVGRVAAWNTLGGVAGSMVVGFVLMPLLGAVQTMALLALGAVIVGGLAAWRGRTSGAHATRTVAVLAAVVVVVGLLTPRDRLAQLLGGSRGGGELLFYAEGAGGTVAVLEQGAVERRFRRLYIQGVSNTGDAMPSLRYMRLQALLPLLIHSGEPKASLVIGLGTGITAGATLRFPGIERPVVAELLPEVVAASSLFGGSFEAVSDRRLDVRLRDGRQELLVRDDVYDLITLEPPPPSAACVANLYSVEFYELARRRLRAGGLLAQWLPLPTQNDEETRGLTASFLAAFPYASLWSTELHEMLLVGSDQPLVLDAERIGQRFALPTVRAALTEVGIDSPEALLATWVTDRDGLVRYAGDARPVTDDHPYIEYAPWVRSDELQRTLPRLLALATLPPVRGAAPEFLQAVVARREVLHEFYRASLHAMAGRREEWATALRRVAAAAPNDPYFRWFGGVGR